MWLSFYEKYLVEITQQFSFRFRNIFATALGVFLSILIFVVLIGLSNGLKQGFNQNIAKNSRFNITLSPGVTAMSYKQTPAFKPIEFTHEHLDLLKGLIDGKGWVTSNYQVGGISSYKERSVGLSVNCVTENFFDIFEQNKVVLGRDLNTLDHIMGRKSVVLGHAASEVLFPGGEPSLNKRILLNEAYFTVVGVFDNSTQDGTQSAYIPQSTYKKMFGMKNIGVLSLEVDYDTDEHIENKLLKAIKGLEEIHPEDWQAVSVNSTREKANAFAHVSIMIGVLAWVVGLATCITGMVGVASLMATSVNERIGEFGIKLALGANKQYVFRVVVFESILLTLIPGCIAIACGTAILFWFEDLTSFFGMQSQYISNPRVAWDEVVLFFCMLMGAGVFSGIIPVQKQINQYPVSKLCFR